MYSSGNAFPCLVAQRIGETILKTIFNNWKPNTKSKLADYKYFRQKYY